MSNRKMIGRLALAVGVLLLAACGKDWQKEVDGAVEAYRDGRYDEAVPVFVSACAMNGGGASKRITKKR